MSDKSFSCFEKIGTCLPLHNPSLLQFLSKGQGERPLVAAMKIGKLGCDGWCNEIEIEECTNWYEDGNCFDNPVLHFDITCGKLNK